MGTASLRAPEIMNIYGSTGLGAAGTGETAHGIVPGRPMSPEVLAALQQMLASGSASPQPVAPAATAPQGGTMTPMAAYIGAGAPSAGPMSMSGGQTAQQQPASQPQNMGQPFAQPGQQLGAPNNYALLVQMLQQLRGGHYAGRD
jgi:hypothetical protein